MESKSTINCPHCGNVIDVQDALQHQVEAEIEKKYNSKLALEKTKIEQAELVLTEEKRLFEEKKTKMNELFQERLDKQLKDETLKIKAKLKSQLEGENEEQFKELQKELNAQSEKLKELNKNKADIARLTREKEELKESIEAEAEIKINQKIAEEKEKIRKSEHEKNDLALKELQKQLDDQKRLTEEMKRRQEQGSMQLQGEVQELAIEEWLADNFPLDTIDEIKKGARGADCLQTVHTRTKHNCGTIYYESKRTKDFQAGWIDKFKNDIQEKGADIGVLVSEALPKDMERMGMRNGIWICSFEEFKGLSVAIRESLIQISNAISSQENKGEKMVMLYDYLTSNEFRMQIEAIVEGFNQMKADLETEKRSIMGHWKKREKQIEKVVLNTNHMYYSIKGIAGNAIQSITALELPEASIELDED